jgi:hypothetical protein
MARFYGEVGFGVTVETIPGIAEGVIIEKKFRGDVLRDSTRFVVGDDVNPDSTISNSISIVASKFAFTNLKEIRYIMFEGERWQVNSLEVKKPRLIIGMGDIYNGPIPAAPGNTE